MTYSLSAEIHCHTNCGKRLFYPPFLYDSIQTETQIIDRCLELDIKILAITDHDSLSSYHAAKAIIASRKLPILLIPACEISCRGGHILAYGIDREIPAGLSPKETIYQIHSQGGLAVAAHPYSWLLSLKRKIFYLNLDAIEVFNSSVSPRMNNLAFSAAKKIKIPGLAGSDAHITSEVGRSLNIFPSLVNSIPAF